MSVCPGSQTLSPTWQNVVALSALPTRGECGICGQTVRVDGFFMCVTHAWSGTPKEPNHD